MALSALVPELFALLARRSLVVFLTNNPDYYDCGTICKLSDGCIGMLGCNEEESFGSMAQYIGISSDISLGHIVPELNSS